MTRSAAPSESRRAVARVQGTTRNIDLIAAAVTDTGRRELCRGARLGRRTRATRNSRGGSLSRKWAAPLNSPRNLTERLAPHTWKQTRSPCGPNCEVAASPALPTVSGKRGMHRGRLPNAHLMPGDTTALSGTLELSGRSGRRGGRQPWHRGREKDRTRIADALVMGADRAEVSEGPRFGWQAWTELQGSPA